MQTENDALPSVPKSHISNITNPKKSKISYVRESSLDYEDPGLSFKCNDNNKSTLLIDVTLNMAQG